MYINVLGRWCVAILTRKIILLAERARRALVTLLLALPTLLASLHGVSTPWWAQDEAKDSLELRAFVFASPRTCCSQVHSYSADTLTGLGVHILGDRPCRAPCIEAAVGVHGDAVERRDEQAHHLVGTHGARRGP